MFEVLVVGDAAELAVAATKRAQMLHHVLGNLQQQTRKYKYCTNINIAQQLRNNSSTVFLLIEAPASIVFVDLFRGASIGRGLLLEGGFYC